MDSNKIKAMIAAAKNANHVGEFPANFYIPMPNRLGAVHSVDDLKEILELRGQVEFFKNGMAELQDYIDKTDLPHAEVKTIADEASR